jgi:ATP-dependent RNA helicase DeaD
MTSAVSEHNSTQHCFVEVGGDLLSKPSSLSDLLEQLGFPTSIVFCNTPSDTDLLEVLLKKRGISANKLIGYVPPQKLERTLQQVRSKEVCAVVVTDIAARNLNLGEFDLVVNYSIQSDGDLYLQRCGIPTGATAETSGGEGERPVRQPAKKVVSMVGPLDIGNFHFLKKAANVEFTKLEPPSKEQVFSARIENLAGKAARSQSGGEENLKAMAAMVLSHPQKDAIVSFLLQNVLEVMPQLSADLEKAVAERDSWVQDDSVQPGAYRQGGGDDDRGNGDRGGGGYGRGRGGRDRDSRGGDNRGGGGRRGGYDSRGGDSRGGFRGGERRFEDAPAGGEENFDDDRQPSDNGGRGYDEGGEGGSYDRGPRQGRGGDRGGYRNDRGDRSDRGGRDRDSRDRGSRDDRPQRNLIRIKEERLYIGRGARDGFTEAQFSQILSEQCGLSADQLKRFSQREAYSFADVTEEAGVKILESLKDKEIGGKKLFVTKAVTLTTTHEGPPDSSEGALEGEPNQNGHEEGAAEPSTLEESYN